MMAWATHASTSIKGFFRNDGGVIVAEGIALYHYNLTKDRSREKCFAAFLHNNWLGAAVFAGMVGDYWVR